MTNNLCSPVPSTIEAVRTAFSAKLEREGVDPDTFFDRSTCSFIDQIEGVTVKVLSHDNEPNTAAGMAQLLLAAMEFQATVQPSRVRIWYWDDVEAPMFFLIGDTSPPAKDRAGDPLSVLYLAKRYSAALKRAYSSPTPTL